MIYPLVHWMLRHERTVLLLTVLAALAGVWAVFRTPIDALPDLSENQVLVYIISYFVTVFNHIVHHIHQLVYLS